MSRKIKEFIGIEEYASLDGLIDVLITIRAHLPANAEPELKMNGDDIFGRKLCISYFRQQTQEEAECDARYAEGYRRLDRPAQAQELQAQGVSRSRHLNWVG
jgi:hypothetical protein